MTYQETIDYIYGLRVRGKKRGLENITQLLHRLGDPQENLQFVHIAGTNGKGSTTAMTASVLQTAGYRTGMFISPFIINFRERMQVDGEMITEQELVEVTARVAREVEKMAAEDCCPSEFEVVTAIGLCWFAQRQCQVVVLEVGLGGRWDATNVIPRSLVSVICSIGLDHVEILGDTIPQIARQKCGIMKPFSTTVCYPDLSEEALAVVMEEAAKMSNQLVLGNKGAAQVLSMGLEGTSLRYGEYQVHIPLIGLHQVYNCINVLETVGVLRQKGFAISQQAVEQGIEAVRFPARLEQLHRRPLVLVDGAHNASGAQVLAEALDLVPGRRIVALMGMLADKDTSGSLAMILPHCQQLFTVTPQNNPRALPAEELAQQAAPWCEAVTPCPSLKEGFVAAWQALKGAEDILLICGSLYLASDLRQIAADFFAQLEGAAE